MQEKLADLKNLICSLAGDESFIHSAWYVDHHLKLAESLAFGFCDLYPDADRDIVCALIWMHDLGKILTSKKLARDAEDSLTIIEAQRILDELGFAAVFIDKVIDHLRVFETYMSCDLEHEDIEVQIASTADACSHYYGPFKQLYWYENHDKGIAWLIESDRQKALRDVRKVTLPEAKARFLPKILEFINYKS